MWPVFHRIQLAWLMQRGHLFPWVPVCLACGIGTYFGVRSEPSAPALASGTILALLLSFAALRWSGGLYLPPLLWASALFYTGIAFAGLRAQMVAEPVLGWRYYGPVEGRLVDIDRSASDRLRLTLDRVRLDIPPDKIPARIRISLHGMAGTDLVPGAQLMTTAHLMPPAGPVEPGGFDFQRHAWFQRLGAVGYTRVPVLASAPPMPGQPLFKARMGLSAQVQAALPGEAGAFAAAIMAGDRSGMGQGVLEDLRITNLAHLLAISGLHLGLLAGAVFAGFRMGLALIPFLALRLPVKKIAAMAALAVSAGYLALSGGNIATERAFTMVAVALLAVMLDRRALSLRAVALAAVIVLLRRPEALPGPGFQMSFAATAALVAVFRSLRHGPDRRVPHWLRPVMAVFLSSLIAGLATAPFAAAHFNQFAHYGLIANLLAVPVMGVLVMPAALIAVALMPFGLEMPALWAMGLGLDWILAVAEYVAGLDGARRMIPVPSPVVLPLLALGALQVILWQGRGRWIGGLPVLVALAAWQQSERPDILVSDSGGLIGVMTPEGRALSKPRGDGFVARIWLENDGDAAPQEIAAERWPEEGGTQICGQDLPCHMLEPDRLEITGALAVYTAPPQIVTVKSWRGERLWTP